MDGDISAHPALSIGAVAGGPGTDQVWKSAVMSLMRRVKHQRAGVASPLAVNVVFHIPGQHLQPEFAGVRTSTFSRKERRLMIQVALPPTSSPTPDVDLQDSLRAAVELAEDFAQLESLVEGQLAELRQLIDRLGQQEN